MNEDARLNAQLRQLGKKVAQLREIVNNINLKSGDERIVWQGTLKYAVNACTVIRQIQSALTPDLYMVRISSYLFPYLDGCPSHGAGVGPRGGRG